MPVERMRVSCGLSTTERIGSFHPDHALLRAAAKLLRFIVFLDEVECEAEEQQELRRVYRQFRKQSDGHFVSMVTSLLLAVLTGPTDPCVSGAFGAGKTRVTSRVHDLQCILFWRDRFSNFVFASVRMVVCFWVCVVWIESGHASLMIVPCCPKSLRQRGVKMLSVFLGS